MKCANCKKSIEATHGNQKKFCSDQCLDEYYMNYRQQWKKEHPEVERSYTAGGHRVYANIKARCGNSNNPSYHLYGGRGIRCEITKDEFLEIYFSIDDCPHCGVRLNDKNRKAKDGRTLDRIDPELSYKKGNLRVLCRSCNSRFARGKRKGEKK